MPWVIMHKVKRTNGKVGKIEGRKLHRKLNSRFVYRLTFVLFSPLFTRSIIECSRSRSSMSSIKTAFWSGFPFTRLFNDLAAVVLCGFLSIDRWLLFGWGAICSWQQSRQQSKCKCQIQMSSGHSNWSNSQAFKHTNTHTDTICICVLMMANCRHLCPFGYYVNVFAYF